MAVRKLPRRWMLSLAVFAGGGGVRRAGVEALQARSQAAVLRSDPGAILSHPALRRLALARGGAVYRSQCASCHGPDGKGDHVQGVPDLTNGTHLYGQGRVSEIEDIARHGIRSGDKQGFDLASMPAFGTAHPYKGEPLPSLTPGQMEDVTQYLLAFTGHATDPQASVRGGALYRNYAGCWDCHGNNGEGDDAVGAPNLTDESWIYGTGTHDDIYRTLEHGRAGISPAFGRKLDAAQLRNVAVYVAALEPQTAKDAAKEGGGAMTEAIAVGTTADGEAAAAPPPPGFWAMGTVNPRRSLLLCAVGAVVGLLVAGFGLFTAHGTRTFVVPPEDAATVNGVPVLRADVVNQLRALDDVSLDGATPEQKRKVLDDMIREELYVQRGVELGAPTDDVDVRQALVAGAEAVVSQDALTSRPSEAELHAWYDAHAEGYAGEGQMTVRDLLLPAGQAAGVDKVVAALRGAAAPASLDLKAARDGEDDAQFYFAAKLHLGDALFAVARTMKDGEVAGPFPRPDGVHILVMAHNQPPLPTRFEDARDRVLHDFLAAKVARLQAGAGRFLRKRADIKIASDFK